VQLGQRHAGVEVGVHGRREAGQHLVHQRVQHRLVGRVGVARGRVRAQAVAGAADAPHRLGRESSAAKVKFSLLR
jgi:hypothetical protein